VIRTDGKPTIAWARDALEAGGHLSDDVAFEILRAKVREVGDDPYMPRLAETLVSDDEALD